MDFGIEISLKRLAMIAYAGYFWNKPIIEDTIFEHFSSEVSQHHIEFLPSLMNMVMNMGLKTVCLPLAIATELKEIIFRLGLSVYDWYRSLYNISNMLIPLKCSNRILLDWTVYGTVNKAKAWKKWIIPVLETAKEIEQEKRKRLTFELYYMACATVHKTFINHHSREMLVFCLENLIKKEHEENGKENEEEYLKFVRRVLFIISSVSYLADEPTHLEKTYLLEYNCLDPTFHCTNHTMFQSSVEELELSVVAIQYYWNLLDVREKEFSLVNTAKECVEKYLKNFNRSHLFYERCSSNDYLDLLIFLFKQMSVEQIEKFLSSASVREKIGVLTGIILSWFWEEFFFSTFELMKKHFSRYCTIGEVKFSLLHLLKATLEAIVCNYDLGFDCKNSISHRMFYTVWEEMEKNENTKFDVSELKGDWWFEEFLLQGLYKGFDIEILNVLLNPLDKDTRIRYLEIGQIYYKAIIGKGQYELIEKFIEVVLKSEERAWFIKNLLNFTADFEEENNRDAVEKIFDWQLSYEENQKKWNSLID